MKSEQFGLSRPELRESLQNGENKLLSLMQDSALPLPAGRLLVRANAEHEYVYRLRSGWACRNRSVADGRDQLILLFLPGDLFAVKSMCVEKHPDSILLLSNCVVERVHYRTLHDAFLRDRDVANRCLWQIMEEERRLHSWVFGLGQGSAEERLALLLVNLRGRLILSGELPQTALTYELPLTQVQIGDHLGVTAVHVNRVIRIFREKGIASIRSHEVSILNLAALTRLAYPLLDPYERSSSVFTGTGESAESA